jgi:hypothetical protein
MAATIWKLSWPLAGMEAGRTCRRCGESIPKTDSFGMSEGVCRPCRLEGERGSLYLMRRSPVRPEILSNAA